MAVTTNATPQPLVRSYAECSNQRVTVANGVDYAFRELGDGGAPRAPAGGSAFRPGKPARISSPVTIARPAV
jgi:hypothetical protein